MNDECRPGWQSFVLHLEFGNGDYATRAPGNSWNERYGFLGRCTLVGIVGNRCAICDASNRIQRVLADVAKNRANMAIRETHTYA